MNDIAIALALHVLAIVLWIGGVGFATMALLPVLMRIPDPARRIETFQAIEHRFARVARASVLLAGATGLYMVFRLDAWRWFTLLPYWWMDAMVLVWVVFAAILFIIEPFVLHRRFIARAGSMPDPTFRKMFWLHWALLAASLVTIFGAVAGGHGMLLFE